MNRLIVLFSLVFALLVQNAFSGETRNWTGSNGKLIQAEFISYDSSSEIVKLKLKDGREQNVKIGLFSKEDQNFVKNKGKVDNPFGEQESGFKTEIVQRSKIDKGVSFGKLITEAEKTIKEQSRRSISSNRYCAGEMRFLRGSSCYLRED